MQSEFLRCVMEAALHRLLCMKVKAFEAEEGEHAVHEAPKKCPAPAGGRLAMEGLEIQVQIAEFSSKGIAMNSEYLSGSGSVAVDTFQHGTDILLFKGSDRLAQR